MLLLPKMSWKNRRTFIHSMLEWFWHEFRTSVNFTINICAFKNLTEFELNWTGLKSRPFSLCLESFMNFCSLLYPLIFSLYQTVYHWFFSLLTDNFIWIQFQLAFSVAYRACVALAHLIRMVNTFITLKSLVDSIHIHTWIKIRCCSDCWMMEMKLSKLIWFIRIENYIQELNA